MKASRPAGWQTQFGFAILLGCVAPNAVAGPLTPEESIRQMRFADELIVEVVASEPQVVDPVAIAFDEELKLWVVEMRDYPNGPANGEKPKSRIKVLLDEDEDGHYETAHTFAEELLFATGIQPWKGGVIVTLAGEVIWLKDTDGDFKADVREPWFTGFSQDNPQLRANHPTFGPDNWIYIANGLRGGKVIAVKPEWAQGAEPVDISGNDFRFDPITGKYEAITGTGQFGLTFDRLGNRFVCSNRNPCMQVLIEDRYLKRNPHLAVKKPLHDVSPAGEASKIFPISRAWTTSNLHAGQFTAACGITFHDGPGLPENLVANAFVCDPTGNLVHQFDPDYSGIGVRARPRKKNVEFLASPDEWFRPVNLSNGPDGSLYIVDMYRAVIEHPRWVPDELKDRKDLWDGNDLGRIYRVSAKHRPPAVERFARPVKASLVNAGQVIPMSGARPWLTETTRRLIVESQNREMSRRLLVATQAPAGDREAALGFVSRDVGFALSTATGTGELRPVDLFAVFELANAQRKRDRSFTANRNIDASLIQAIRLSEPFLQKDSRLLAAVIAQADHSRRVQYQLALSLGEVGLNEETLPVLARIAAEQSHSEPHRIAVLSSIGESPLRFFETFWMQVRAKKLWGRDGIREFVTELARVIAGRRQSDEVERVREFIAASVNQNDRANTTTGIELARRRIEMAAFRGLASAGKLKAFDLVRGEPVRVSRPLVTLFGSAAYLGGNKDMDRDVRLEALSTLGVGYARVQGQLSTLTRVFVETDDASLKSVALDGLTRLKQKNLGETLLKVWPQAGVSLRRELLNSFVSSPDAAEVLAGEILNNRIAVADLAAAHRTRLLRLVAKETQTRIQKALAEAAPKDRQEVVAEYQPSLSIEGSPLNGKQLFEKNCAACHRIGEVGVNVAPDISDSRTKTPAQLLESILNPNKAVDANYFAYSLVTDSGKVYSGVLSAETANSVSLKLQEGKTVTVLRSEIDELRNTGISLMPVGLEKNLSKEQLADVIAFIKNWRYLDGKTPLRVPAK